MSLPVIPAPPGPPRTFSFDRFETAIFTVTSTGTLIITTYAGQMSPQESTSLSAGAGAGAVALKRFIEGIVPATYRRTRWGKRKHLKRSIERVEWFAQNLRNLEEHGYLTNPRDQVMLSEVLALDDGCRKGALEDTEVIDEVLARNISHYQSRIANFKPGRQLPPQ